MSFQGLGFVTHREIEALLGGGAAAGRQRRRLVARGWLPRAPLVFADRRRVAIYPEFALSSLVIGASSTRGLRRPVESAATNAQRLYTSRAYRKIAAVLAQALHDVALEDVVELARRAAELDIGAIAGWRNDVADCADRLTFLGVELDVLPARVRDAGAVYVVDLDGRTESHFVEDAPARLRLGDLVTRDRVRVASVSRDFLLPVPDLTELGLGARPDLDALADDDELTRALFEGLSEHVRVLPSLGAAREPVDSVGVNLNTPWALLAGGNSMSRRARQSA